MAVILAAALIVIGIIHFVILPRAYSALKTIFFQSPASQNLSFKTYIARLPLVLLIMGGMYFVVMEIGDEEAANILLFGFAVAVIFFTAYFSYHFALKPFWASLPATIAQYFQTTAPGYQALRVLSYRHRAEIAGLIVLCVALLVLIGRFIGIFDEHQPIIVGIGIVDYINDFRMTMPEYFFGNIDQMRASKLHVLYLIEILVILFISTGVFLFAALPLINRFLLFIPSFNIQLTFIDHLGLLLACVLGIALGYLPALL